MFLNAASKNVFISEFLIIFREKLDNLKSQEILRVEQVLVNEKILEKQNISDQFLNLVDDERKKSLNEESNKAFLYQLKKIKNKSFKLILGSQL